MTTSPALPCLLALPWVLLVALPRLGTVDAFCPTPLLPPHTRTLARDHVRHLLPSRVPVSGGIRMQGWDRDLLLATPDLFDDSHLPPVPLVLLGGLAVLAAAQLWINRLATGEGGLGSFLNDGRGYANSAFVLDDDNRAVSSDPLPWLKLPKLDYVEVAGQDDADDNKKQQFLDRLRGLQEEMEASLERGDYEGASRLRNELERLLSDNSARLDSFLGSAAFHQDR